MLELQAVLPLSPLPPQDLNFLGLGLVGGLQQH